MLQTIIDQIIPHKNLAKTTATATADTNIALIKYWGKRNEALRLPTNDSLSISIPNKGCTTCITAIDAQEDQVILNNQPIASTQAFHQRLVTFLNYFRSNPKQHFRINTTSNIPIAAGLASSACGFAALVLALNDLYDWQLCDQNLSILARLGSGSACRSLWKGFVHWHMGTRDDGMDSFAEPVDLNWPGLCIGLMLVDDKEKPIGSSEAMRITMATAKRFRHWPAQSMQDLDTLIYSIKERNFNVFGTTLENNALAMHACMEDATPTIRYSTAQTLALRQQAWQLRAAGVPVFFTQDAGPNLKLVFLKKELDAITDAFPNVEVMHVS